VYLIRTIAGVRYLQLTEKLPRKIENAVTHRYERSRFVVRALLLVLLGILIVAVVLMSSQQPGDEIGDAEPGYLFGIALCVVFMVVTFLQLSLMDRHKSVMDDLRKGFAYREPSPRQYLMPEDEPIYRALMAPQLEAYLSDPNNHLWSEGEIYLKEYLAQADIVVAKAQRSVREERSEFKKLQIDYTARQTLNALGEEYAKLIGPTISHGGMTFGGYFAEQRTKTERSYRSNCQHLAETSVKEINRLKLEAQQAYAEGEDEKARSATA